MTLAPHAISQNQQAVVLRVKKLRRSLGLTGNQPTLR